MKLIGLSSTGSSCRFVDSWIYSVLCCLKDCPEGKGMTRNDIEAATGCDDDDLKEMLAVIRSWDVVRINSGFVMLTEYGRQLVCSLPIRIVCFPHTRYVIGNHQCGVVIHGVSGKVTNGILQRNCAVKAGARGASVFVRIHDNIFMPPEWRMEFFDPELADAMRKEGVCNEDVVIIAGADTKADARNAAVSAALETL